MSIFEEYVAFKIQHNFADCLTQNINVEHHLV